MISVVQSSRHQILLRQPWIHLQQMLHQLVRVLHLFQLAAVIGIATPVDLFRYV
jgi:hypothetical protein